MPVLKLCASPGCQRRVRTGRCDEHRRAESKRKRLRRRELGAEDNPQWRRLRQATLFRDGYKCVECGRTTDLTVDHIEHERAFEISGLRTLCRACNSARH